MNPPVICYHRVGGPLELGVTRVARTVFERQMRTLATAGWRALTLSQFADAVRVPRPTPHAPHTFLLTFDDGDGLLAQHAYPVLAGLGFRAATFLVTDYVGSVNAWDVRYALRRLRHLSWDDIERWGARGFDFASHTATHARLTWLDDARVADELGRSREVLIRRLGTGAGRAVAYPFGASDQRVGHLAAAAGYELGFGGVMGSGGSLDLPRVPVYAWDRGAVPLGLRPDRVGALGRMVAHAANRCSVVTSALNSIVR